MTRQARHSHSREGHRNRGRMTLLLGVVVAVTVGVAALFWTMNPGREVTTDPSTPGRLVAEQPTVDLGRVPFDRLVEARFELDNTGGDVVRLVGAPRVRMLEGC